MLISTQKCLFLKSGKHEGMLTLYICIAPKKYCASVYNGTK